MAIVIASMSFIARMLRKSFSVAGASPISFCVAAANFFRMLLSTSHTCEMRAFALLAFSDERDARSARPFRPMTAKLSRSFDPMICA